MFSFCRDLCRSKKEKEKSKKDKKDKHGNSGSKEDGKGNKHKPKNAYTFSIIGQGKKNTDQDTSLIFEIVEENNTIVRFYGIFDGHGDFGKEASVLANQEFEAFIRGNIKKILKMKDLKDYKERVKKLLKVMYIDCQKKYERNVS
jgi:serine/threonine protein phosphatase PrpC